MRPLLSLCAALLLTLSALVGQVSAQTWEVVRRARLLTEPQVGQRIKTLQPQAVVTEIGGPDGEYLQVRDATGDEGWIYRPYLRASVSGDADNAGADLGLSADVATAISSSWDKPEPNHSQFTSNGVTCGPSGEGTETETNLRKNRTDIPTSYHKVTFQAVDGLPYPVATKQRTRWSSDQLAQIEPYEGVALTVEGYLVALRVQTSGNGESCNCYMTGKDEVDWHMALVGAPGDGEEQALVVETTPRVRRHHPGWTPIIIREWVDSDNPVRISGWLMLDPEHRNHLNRYRNTLWEIHPITKIEVFNNGVWVNVDMLP